LRLPSEAADARGAGRLGDADDRVLPANEAARLERLYVRDVDERLVGDCLDEAEAEDARRRAKRADFVAVEYPLLDGRVDRAAMNERPAGVVGEDAVCEVAGAHLEYLAVAAHRRVLVAVAARDCVVDGTDAVGDMLLFGEGILDALEY